MTDTIVDTNVIIDVVAEDPAWMDWSARQLANAVEDGELIVNQLVYSELAPGYPGREELDDVLTRRGFRLESLPWDASFLAGIAFLSYRRRGGPRLSLLPDFYIGAHAATRGYRVLTRDRSYYTAYFPTLSLVTPETHP